jgi:hypothetical protein
MPICPAPKICQYSGWLNALAHLRAYTSDVAGRIYSHICGTIICMFLFYLERHLGKTPPENTPKPKIILYVYQGNPERHSHHRLVRLRAPRLAPETALRRTVGGAGRSWTLTICTSPSLLSDSSSLDDSDSDSAFSPRDWVPCGRVSRGD